MKRWKRLCQQCRRAFETSGSELCSRCRKEIKKKNLKHFGVYIKSHCEASDFEDTIWAKDKTEAVSLIKRRHSFVLQEWNEKDLDRYVEEI